MSDNENELLERLKSLVLTGKLRWQHAKPPATETDIQRAEATLGSSLPPLLKRIYLEVGNGGFGPGDGLFPLNNEEDPKALHTDSLVTTYLVMHSATPEQMEAYMQGDVYAPPLLPEKVLMICDWGCNISSWIDCSQSELPVLKSEATLDWSRFVVEAPSFHQWLETWVESMEHLFGERP